MNSDFWKDPGHKEQFGAVCINTIPRYYKFKNRLDLTISDTTFVQMKRAGELNKELRSTMYCLGRYTMLGNFSQVEKCKTVEMLEDIVTKGHIKQCKFTDFHTEFCIVSSFSFLPHPLIFYRNNLQ